MKGSHKFYYGTKADLKQEDLIDQALIQITVR